MNLEEIISTVLDGLTTVMEAVQVLLDNQKLMTERVIALESGIIKKENNNIERGYHI